MSSTTCPICFNTNIDLIYNIPCSIFDQSYLYENIKIVSCNHCGHVFNSLTETELNNLNKYYNEEYKNCNENSTTKKIDNGREEQLTKFLHGYQSVHVIDLSIEHISTPHTIFENITEPYLSIGAPDSVRYPEYTFFNPYWIIMREHIQHFDLLHLLLLAEMHKFKLENFNLSSIPLMNKTMEIPIITVLFKRVDHEVQSQNIDKDFFILKTIIKNYIECSIYNLKESLTKIPTNKHVYFWGIGREFLFINKFLNPNINKILIDNNEYKQNNLTIGGIKIQDESLLKLADSNSILILTATAHKEVLKRKLKTFNFKGKVYSI